MTNGRMRVALLGAGYIAQVHAEILTRLSTIVIAAIIDPIQERAKSLARLYDVGTTAISFDALGENADIQVVHVLTPPATHRPVAEPILKRGIHVLLEKPMAISEADCVALEEVADKGGALLTVNHNFVYHPAFVRLQKAAAVGKIGNIKHIDIIYMMPLRQLTNSQFGHWMFQNPSNLLLEQAVHPLSQLDALIGPLTIRTVIPSKVRTFGNAVDLITTWLVAGDNGQRPASLLTW